MVAVDFIRRNIMHLLILMQSEEQPLGTSSDKKE